MDHLLDKLDECIFDYLASNAGQPKMIDDIFKDITGSTGHRCSELENSLNHRRLFTSTCYTLDKYYKNVRKLFRLGNQLYLVFDKDRKYETYDDSIFETKQSSKWDIDSNNAVSESINWSTFDASYFNKPFDYSNTVLHLAIENNDVYTLKSILKVPGLNLECLNKDGLTPIELAETHSNGVILTMLIDYQYKERIRKLESDIRRLENDLKKERELEREYQKTIEVTGRNLDMMNKIEGNRETPRKIIYMNQPLSTFSRYTTNLGYFVECLFILYFVYKISWLIY